MIQQFINRHRNFLACLGVMFVVRGTFADQNYVPTGSMEPTIQVGDHILVNKVAYDLRLPYSEVTLASFASPQRGDVVVFINPKNKMRMVKRVVGLPGDHLRVHDGFITVNGQPVSGSASGEHVVADWSQDEVFYPEQLGSHHAEIKRTHSLLRHEDGEYQVPADHFFAMGDNRDNSLDSRGWGFIPRQKIEGQAVGVIYNLSWNPLPQLEMSRTGLKFN